MFFKFICFFSGRHWGPKGVNPENKNTEVHCRRCGRWTPIRGFSVHNGEFAEYFG